MTGMENNLQIQCVEKTIHFVETPKLGEQFFSRAQTIT